MVLLIVGKIMETTKIQVNLQNNPLITYITFAVKVAIFRTIIPLSKVRIEWPILYICCRGKRGHS